MNWLINTLIKEARGRRFKIDDTVRYFTDGRKGKGRNIVVTPNFGRGKVVDFDRESRRYKVKNDREEIVDIHPRNIVPDSVNRNIPNSQTSPMETNAPVEINTVI